MRAAFLLTLAGAALAAPTAAYADNDCAVLAPSVQPDPVTATYNPFDAVATNRDFSVDVRTVDCPEKEEFFLTIDSPDVGVTDGENIVLTGPGGETLTAIISDRSGVNGNGQNDRFNVKQGIATLYVQLSRGQIVSPGVYRAPMRATTMLNNGNNTPHEDQLFDVIVTVGPVVGLAPATGTELDLGELEAGDSAVTPVTFDAYANVDYELSVSSDYAFNLRRNGNPSLEGAGYVPVLDGTALAVSDAEADFSRPTVDFHRRHELNVQVPSVNGLPAGDYEDVLTVQISAKVGG
jgi:hypothetical protein